MNGGKIIPEKVVVPPHLHDLQEADLPETQRGLVMSEIQLFREKSAKREQEKMNDLPKPSLQSNTRQREWGKAQGAWNGPASTRSPVDQGSGKGAHNYSKPVGFVKEEGSGTPDGGAQKSDLELEEERKEARRRDEENSFRDVSLFVIFRYLNQD